MRVSLLPLLLLLPLLPLPAAATGAGEPQAEEAAPRQEDAQGRFLAGLTRATPKEAAAMIAAMKDINATAGDERITALHAAVAYNRLDILSLLLARGADTERLMKPGLTPLSAAAMKNDTDAISMLLAHGARLDYQTPGGVSALKLACAKGNLDAAQVLLAHGADPKPADSEGHTALTLAQEHAGENHLPLMRMLLEHGASADARVGEQGWSPLERAIFLHDLPAAELLLRHGANVDPVGGSDSSPLMIASAYGYAGLVKDLLERGASPTRQDDDGNDSLDHAALGAHFTHGLLSAANGEDFSIKNSDRVDMAETCRLLLARGASLQHADGTGSTPLILASRVCAADNVRFLLQAGADIRDKDKEGHNALISALLPVEDKIRLTFSPGADMETHERALRLLTPLLETPQEQEATLRLLLDAGADPTEQDATGRSALDYAEGTPALHQLLLQYLPCAHASR